MKLDDRNMDQLFRDAAQNASAPKYSASYWNDVASMLNADQRKRRALVLWSLGGGVSLILLFSLLLGLGLENSEPRYTENSSTSIHPIQFAEFEKNKNDLSTGNSKIENSEKSLTRSQLIKSTEKSSIESSSRENSKNTELANNNQSNIISNLQTKSKTNIPVSSNLSDHLNSVNLNAIATLPIRKFSLIPESVYSANLTPSNDKKWNLHAEINLGIMENYKTSRPFQSGLMNFALKGSYTFSSIQISSGIGLQVSTNTDLVVSQRAKYYGFGVVNYQTDLSYQNMYDVFIPVEFGYNHGKTSFGVGLQANYLVNTSMKLQEYEDNELLNSKKIEGYNNGLKKFSSQGYVWINQQITPRFSGGLKIGTNFSSRIQEGDYFNESATTNPVFGQISLRYNIFK
jgi:hypothetical protein